MQLSHLTRLREPVNGLTHLGGALAATLGIVWLLSLAGDDPLKRAAVFVYGLSQVMLFTASGIYHSVNGSQKTLLWLQRIDHAAIYVLIAGSYTPFCLFVLVGEWRWITLIVVWTMALGGVVYKLLFLVKPGIFSLLYYVLMGCFAFLIPPSARQSIPPEVVALLLVGGVVFLSGAVIFGLEKPNFHRHLGHHELWHLFVLAGSVVHFAAVALSLQAL